MFGQDQYDTYKCVKHNKTIYYHKKDSHLVGHHCWDCMRDANNQRYKTEEKLHGAKELFKKEYSHLWTPQTSGGIVSLQIKNGELLTLIKSSVEVFNEVPNEYHGFNILKQIVGEAA